jgi:hypothetical protein
MSDNEKRAAIDVAKERADDGVEATVALPYGVTGTIIPVPPQLVEEVTSRIREPEVPVWHNEDKGRDEPNPSDPEYLAAIEEAERLRGIASIDTMALFGIDIDGLPDDDKWLKKLTLMEKRGLLDLSDYDLEDEEEKEFVYKRFVALNNTVLQQIIKVSGITAEEVEAAEASFPGNEEG